MIGELAALGAAVCWTVSATLYKEALLKISPFPANTMRCVSTSAVLVLCLAVAGKTYALTTLPIEIAGLASISGVIGLGLGDTLYMKSLRLIGVARSVPLTCTYPLFTLIFAVFAEGETVTLHVILGTLLIVLGVWLVSQQHSDEQGPEKNLLRKGTAFALATAVVWATSIAMIDIAVNLTGETSLDYALAINTLRVIAVALLLSIFSPFIGGVSALRRSQRRTLVLVASAGAIALALGWFFLTFSFLHIPGSRAIPISSTTPLFAAFSGIFLLKEKVAARNVVGAGTVVFGVLLIFAF